MNSSGAAVSAIDGVTGEPWTAFEIVATVNAYLEMREMELRGEAYTKTKVVRELGAMLPARSPRAIESKFQNISAVLDELGRSRIEGYKPLPHYQHALRLAVLHALSGTRRIREAEEAYETSSLVAPSSRRRATEDVLVPVPGGGPDRKRRSRVALTGGDVAVLRDFRRQTLGMAGEEWVVGLERESLRRAGRDDLAGKVEWSARDLGDGLGYDVTSFRPNGIRRIIEVKTTNLGPMTPFYITRWEIEVSHERADQYSLYRVHGFARDPRIYVLDGDINTNARLDPKVFLGIPL